MSHFLNNTGNKRRADEQERSLTVANFPSTGVRVDDMLEEFMDKVKLATGQDFTEENGIALVNFVRDRRSMELISKNEQYDGMLVATADTLQSADWWGKALNKQLNHSSTGVYIGGNRLTVIPANSGLRSCEDVFLDITVPRI